MNEVQEYRVREYVRAERIAENGTVFVTTGPVPGYDGDYLVHGSGGVVYVKAAEFESVYEVVPESVSEARKYTPDGKTVEKVLQFFREYPGEVERVKDLEKAGGSRKAILEYEIR